MRVRDRKKAEAFFQCIFDVLGGEKSIGPGFTTFSRPLDGGLSGGGKSENWLGFTEDPEMVAGMTTVALFAPDRETVDRVVAILPEIGALAIERDDGVYGHNYYAVFFKDPDGNPLEVVCYESEE
jgi:catechol 2,3-dioxygenase-like lactoylglutathione lyase family enzyme